MKLGEEAKRHVRNEMRGLRGAESGAHVKALATQYDVSKGTIYRLIKHDRPERAPRADSGQARSIQVPEDVLEALRFFSVGKGFSARKIVEIGESMGHEFSEAWWNRHLAAHGVSQGENRQDLRAYHPWEASHSNAIHQLDSTMSQQFYMTEDEQVAYESPLKRNKNKPGNQRPRMWLIVVLDDYSRSVYAEFTKGNDTHAWLNVLANAWRLKNDPEFPFCGLPDVLYTDNDAVVGSAKFQRVLASFDPPIELQRATPYNSRAKGKVERVIRTIQEDFEIVNKAAVFEHLAQHIQQDHEGVKWASIDAANEALIDWCKTYNNRIHGTTGRAPFQKWMGGIEQPRVIDDAELIRRVSMDRHAPQIRKDLCVQINGHTYQLPFEAPWLDMVGQKADVWWSAEYPDAVYVDHLGESREITQFAGPMDAFDFEKTSVALSNRERERLELAKMPDPEHIPTPVHEHPAFVLPTARTQKAIQPDIEPPKLVLVTPFKAKRMFQESNVFHDKLQQAELDYVARLFGDADELPIERIHQAISDVTRAAKNRIPISQMDTQLEARVA